MINLFTINCIEKTKIRKKRLLGKSPFFKKRLRDRIKPHWEKLTIIFLNERARVLNKIDRKTGTIRKIHTERGGELNHIEKERLWCETKRYSWGYKLDKKRGKSRKERERKRITKQETQSKIEKERVTKPTSRRNIQSFNTETVVQRNQVKILFWEKLTEKNQPTGGGGLVLKTQPFSFQKWNLYKEENFYFLLHGMNGSRKTSCDGLANKKVDYIHWLTILILTDWKLSSEQLSNYDRRVIVPKIGH